MRKSGSDTKVIEVNQVSQQIAAKEIPVALQAPSISPTPRPRPKTPNLKRGHFYFGSNRTFLFWLDTSPKRS